MNDYLKADIKLKEEETFQQKHSFVQPILSSNKSCNHYTGIPFIGILNAIYKYLDPGVNGENVILYNNQEIRQDTSRGRKRVLSSAESYLLTLVQYQQNYSIYHLAYLFETSEGDTSNTITSWTDFMYLKLGSIPIWSTQEQIMKIMPKSMKDRFQNVRCIIDCVEFKVAVHSSLFLHKIDVQWL